MVLMAAKIQCDAAAVATRPVVLLLLLLLAQVGGATQKTPLEGQRVKLSAAKPCVRLLNATTTIGCATPSRGVLAQLQVLRTPEEIASFVASPPSEATAVALAADIFSPATIAAVTGALKDDMAGVLVLHAPFPPPSIASPATPSGEPAGGGGQWIERASGLSMQRFRFAIVLLSKDESDAVLSAAQQAGAARLPLVELRYPMNARGDSRRCLTEGTCLPVGGQSVWGSLQAHPTKDGSSGGTRLKPVAALAVGLDAASFFHDEAPGGYTTVAPLAAMLAAIHSLATNSQFSSQLPALPNQMLFFAFEAESWDETGSRRFLFDVHNFTCLDDSASSSSPREGCAFPVKRDLTFKALASASTKGVIQIGPVGSQHGDGTSSQFFVHTQAQNRNNTPATAIRAQGSSRIAVVDASGGLGLPPGAARSFIDPSLALPGGASQVATLTDFDMDMSHGGRTGSRFDTFDALRATRVCDASAVAARAWWLMAGGTGVPDVNCTLVHTLLMCLLPGADGGAGECELADRYGLAAASLGSHYSGVFTSSSTQSTISPTATFVKAFLDETLRDTCNEAPCSPFLLLHDSFSRGIEPANLEGAWRVTDRTEPIWAESNWPAEMHATLYPHGAPTASEAVPLVVAGATVTCVTWLAVFLSKQMHKRAYKRL